MKSVTIKINQEEYKAIASMVDLAGCTVSDAEYDHELSQGTKRRGGYSADLRKSQRFLDKIAKAFNRAKTEL